MPMQIIALRTLRAFWTLHPQAEQPLKSWFSAVKKAEWQSPADVKAMYRSADFVADNRVIFNIGGNKYRLVVHVSYEFRRVLIKFVGIHSDYDNIDAESV
jgi:mRNA interferase HigB